MDKEALDKLGSLIDIACDKNDKDKLESIVKKYSDEYIEALDDESTKVHLYYFLSNAWSGLKDIIYEENKDKIWGLEQKEVFKTIYYLRKSILAKKFNDINMALKTSIYTNLGNTFSYYGRTINALKCYDKALEVDPLFFMVLINKAICLETYAKLDYDPSHQNLMLRCAYFNYKKSSKVIQDYIKENIHDRAYYEPIYNMISSSNDKIENYLTLEWLNKSIDFDYCELGTSQDEVEYREWALDNNLFLNSMNDFNNSNIAGYDPLGLPNMITDIKLGFPKYITYFNQIKQEYIAYRHLLFEGLSKPTEEFYNKETSIIDDHDYNLYSIDIEKIKLAFRGFYSLFDKVANFMNEYFKLGLNERQVDFRKVWYLEKNPKINPFFDKSENLALRGLYLISKDLYFNNKDEESKEFIAALEPEAKKINEIRNHLEHKFIMIKMFDMESSPEYIDRERCFNISEVDLEAKTIHLGQLIREAIIYLSFSVHIEENKKDKKGEYMNIPLSIVER